MDVISKIKKLLQLADTKRNSNIEEAAAAAAKAQKLMEKHRIHKAMLEDDLSIIAKLLEDHGKPENWKLFLASSLAKNNGSYVVQSEKYQEDNKIFIVGSINDTTTIQYLYTYVVSELNRLCLAELMLFKVNFNISLMPGFTNSFYLGAISILDQRLQEATLQARLHELKRAVHPESKAAIASALQKMDSRIDKAKEWIKENLKAKITDVILDNSSTEGYVAGKKAAQQIDLAPNKRLEKNDRKI